MLDQRSEILNLILEMWFGLEEDDIQLILKQITSFRITYETPRVLTQLKIFQRLFTQWVIMKELYKRKKII